MFCNEECVEFENQDGHLLRGILHYGDHEVSKTVSLICLNTGLNDMVGWHRIQVKTSRYLAALGYNVLRFDDIGIGDSGGEINKTGVVEIFSDIETGLFVSNADAAVAFMAEVFPANKLVFIGFCGGGLTATHSAGYNEKVSGIINIGGPVTLSSKEYLHKKDPWEVQKNVKKYKSKLFNFRPWINFFTFRGEYKIIINSITNYIKHKINGEYKDSLSLQELEDVENLNKKYFFSFESYSKSRRPALFFYAEKDSATWEFKKYFLSKYQNSSFWSDKAFTFIEAESANHILSSEESQELLKKTICSWLKTHFCFEG